MDEVDKKGTDVEQAPPAEGNASGEAKPKRYKPPTIARHGNLRMMTELE